MKFNAGKDGRDDFLKKHGLYIYSKRNLKFFDESLLSRQFVVK